MKLRHNQQKNVSVACSRTKILQDEIKKQRTSYDNVYTQS
jgi:hypothetical protein